MLTRAPLLVEYRDGVIFAARGNPQMPPILRAFELATHPRVLMVGIPIACVVSVSA